MLRLTIYFYLIVLFVIFGAVSYWVVFITGRHPILWYGFTCYFANYDRSIRILEYLREHSQELLLVIYWGACLVILLPLIEVIRKYLIEHDYSWSRVDVNRYQIPNIIIRKCFHLLGLILFVPAIIIAPYFLALGYAVAFAAMLIVELIKYTSGPLLLPIP